MLYYPSHVFLEKTMATHPSTLAWKIPWMEEPGRLQSMESLRVGHNRATSLSLSCIGGGDGNPLQCSCLENPREGGAWWAAIYGVARVRHNWSDLAAAACIIGFSSVTQLCLTLCNLMNCSSSGLPVHHQLLESTQTHVHWVGDAIQPSHPLSSPSPALNLSWHQSLSQWVSSLHQVAKVLEFQLQHQSYQRTLRTDLL